MGLKNRLLEDIKSYLPVIKGVDPHIRDLWADDLYRLFLIELNNRKNMVTFGQTLINSQWMSISDFLPENSTFVLASISTEIDSWVEIVGFFNNDFQLPGRGLTKNVTHWMQLPKPHHK